MNRRKDGYVPRPLKRLRTRSDGTMEQVPVDPKTVRALARQAPPTVQPRKAERLEKIALRCWVEPDGWRPEHRPHRSVRWKDAPLFIHTVGAAGESGPLWFGVAELATAERVLRRWVFYREGIPASDVGALAESARALGWPPPIPLGDYKGGFLRAFKQLAWKRRHPVVGFPLPTQLARLAADWRSGRSGTFFEGGFVLILGTKPPPAGKVRWKGKERRLRNGRVEDGDFPTIGVKAIEGLRAFMSFLGTGRPDERDRIPEGGEGRPDPSYRFQGYFVDLLRLAYPFAGKNVSLGEACELFGAGPGPGSVQADGPNEGQLQQAIAGIEAVRRLYVALLALHRQIAGDSLHPHEVYTAASYVPATLDRMGLSQPLVRWPEFPRELLAWSMAALFAGRSELGVRRIPEVPIPVVVLDYVGLYGAVASLAGAWDLLTAERIEISDQGPQALREWIAGLTLDDLLDPPTWRLLNVLVKIRPGGEVLPARIPSGKTWALSVGPLTAEPGWFFLPDIIVAMLESGAIPEIERAVRLQPVGRVQGLAPVELPGIGRFDPTEPGADLFRFLTLGRARLKYETQHPTSDLKDRLLAGFYKVFLNAACSGVLMRADRTEPRKGRWKVRVWGPDSEGPDDFFRPRPRPLRTDVPGPWSFPPVAGLVLAGGRLAEAIAFRVVREAGGTVAYADTDSVFVVADRSGGILPCPGGTERTEDGREGIRMLSWPEVEAIRARIEPLSLYPEELRPRQPVRVEQPPYKDRLGRLHRSRALPSWQELPYFLRLAQENYDGGPTWRRQVYLYGQRSKAYALYFLERPGPSVRAAPPPEVVYPTEEEYREFTVVRIRKVSEHGLAHITDPRNLGSRDTSWMEADYRYLIRRDLGLVVSEPGFAGDPAFSLIPLSHPSLPPASAGRGRLTFLWPFGLVLEAHVAGRGFLDEERKSVVPVAPFLPGAGIRTAWFDRKSGRSLPGIIAESAVDSLGAFADGPVIVEDHGSLIRMLSRWSDAKASTPSGHAVRGGTAGLLVPRVIEAYDRVLIGKETAITPGLPLGLVEDPDEHFAVYRDPRRDKEADAARHALKDHRLKAGPEARRLGVPKSTFHAVLAGRPMTEAMRGILVPLAARFGRDALRMDQPDRPTPKDDERALHAYARESGRLEPRLCWACGHPLEGRQTKWCSRACAARGRRSPVPRSKKQIRRGPVISSNGLYPSILESPRRLPALTTSRKRSDVRCGPGPAA